jgi:hypothetical protein
MKHTFSSPETSGTVVPPVSPQPLFSSSFLCLFCLAALTLGGCIERRMFITSDPQGATVWLNDTEVGVTPVEVDFTYFGVYDVRLRKPGYEPLTTRAEAKAPLHEQPGVDLAAMAIPAKKTTRVDWHFTLEPVNNDPAGLVERAGELRGRLEPDQASN